jgi:hypothetical protein
LPAVDIMLEKLVETRGGTWELNVDGKDEDEEVEGEGWT